MSDLAELLAMSLGQSAAVMAVRMRMVDVQRLVEALRVKVEEGGRVSHGDLAHVSRALAACLGTVEAPPLSD